jgi:cysteine synthase A
VLAAGIGTGGTVVGVSKYLKEHSTNITILGITPTPDQVPGTRSLERLGEVGHNWETAIGHRIDVSVRESYKASLRLCRSGILGGPSSGLAYAGLLQFLAKVRDADARCSFNNERGELLAVFICPDTLLPYLDKYTTHLDPTDLA